MSAPAAAAAAFGGRLDLAERYADWLTGAGIERGLLGPREAPRVWERHLLNCAALAPLIPHQATVVDVGSGAGLPGIPLAIARADLTVTLVEPLLRRSAFLDMVTADLALGVRVLRSRAEDVHEQYDVVVSRALAPLDRLIRWTAGLVAPGGSMLALKGSSAARELDEHRSMMSRFGVSDAEVVELPTADGEVATVIVMHRQREVRR